MSGLTIAQLFDADHNLIDSFSFRDASELAPRISRLSVQPGDRILFKQGGRARVTSLTDVTNVVPFNSQEHTQC